MIKQTRGRPRSIRFGSVQCDRSDGNEASFIAAKRVLDLECIDRMYLNVYVPRCRFCGCPGGYFVPTPIRKVCGVTISSALLNCRSAPSISAQAAARSASVACVSS